MEVVASLSQGRTAAAQCGLFTHKSVQVIFEPPCNLKSCNVLLRIVLICIRNYQKSAFNFVLISFGHLYLREQGCEDERLFFKTIGDPRKNV